MNTNITTAAGTREEHTYSSGPPPPAVVTNEDDRSSSDSTDPTDADDDDPFVGGETADQDVNASAKEEAALQRVRRVSTLLDEAFRVPGTNYRIGIDPLIGILPGAGDAVTTVLSLYPVLEAYRLGVSRGTLAKMVARVAIDGVTGSIPVLGTLFDAVWKANKWNVRTVEQHLQQK